MKIIVLSDTHLKLEPLAKVDKLLSVHPDWKCVALGDWADDWQRPVDDYKLFFSHLLEFCRKNQDRLYLCWGNHDYAYWADLGLCSGYVQDAKDIVRAALCSIDEVCSIHIAHQIENVLFSHAGIGRYTFTQYCRNLHNYPYLSLLDWLDCQDYIGLRNTALPLWMRPSENKYRNTFNNKLLQVVGHTPVETIIHEPTANTLYTDTWSTDSERNPLGDKSLVVVDTKTQGWEIIPYE